MKSAARISMLLLAGFLLFLGYGFAASSLQTISPSDVLSFGPTAGPAVLPQSYNNFNPNNIPEIHRVVPPNMDPKAPKGYAYDPAKIGDSLGSHRVPVVPASAVKPSVQPIGIPLVNNEKNENVNLNEEEDDLSFVSNLHTDTTFYGNVAGGASALSSLDKGFFFEENLRYDLYTMRGTDDSLALTFDSTFSNDKREYKDSYTPNQFTLESRTPKSLLAFGHTYPEFSTFSMTQQLLGFYGVQRFDNFGIKAFSGYKAMERDDLKNPRWSNGFRMEHQNDESLLIGISGISTRDTKANPGINQDLPTLENSLVGLDMEIKPLDRVSLYGEVARSKTEYDLRNPLGDQSDSAYRFGGIYYWENYRFEGGVEEAGSAFLTAMGESPRDERAYFGRFFYDLNRYVSTKIGGRFSRDNLASFKTSNIVRSLPEFLLTLRPSDYYKDLRIDFFYQPSREYSENSSFIDRYKDTGWLEINHKAGAIRYFAGLTSIIDKDKITALNDKDIGKVDLKLTWEYDAFRQVYGLCSVENLNYKIAGGVDKTIFYGFGGRSHFHDDIDLTLEYTHENDDVKTVLADSKHDKVNFSLSKEYNNQSRVIFDLTGSNNIFENGSRNFNDLAAKLRFLKSF